MDGAEVKVALEAGGGTGRRRWRRRLVAGSLSLVALGALAGGIYWTWLNTPPPPPRTVEEALALVQSARFKRLPEERQAQYLDQAREMFGALPPDQRKALREQVREDPALREAVTQAQEVFALNLGKQYAHAGAEERKAMVDKLILMMEMQRALRGGSGRKPAADDVARMKQYIQERIERGNPQQQQHFSEFLQDVRARRKQMGLKEDF